MSKQGIVAAAAAAAAILGIASAANAAGVHMPVAPPPSSSSFDWSGFYAGLHIGGVAGSESDDLAPAGGPPPPPPPPPPVGADSFSMSGLIGGVYAGENWQEDDVVYGLEGVIDLSSLSGQAGFSGPPSGTLTLSTNLQGSLRGRVGLAQDRALFYADLGLALAHATLTATGAGGTASDSGTSFGVTGGVGVEYAIDADWIGRAELQLSAFQPHAYNLAAPYGTTNASWTQGALTIGIEHPLH